LGELSSHQLARPPSTAATTLTDAGLEDATRAWAALRAPAPAGLGIIAEAYHRLAREYPDTRDGLSLTERRILAAFAQGAMTAGTAFVRTIAKETRPFLGDIWSFDRMTRLSQAPTPLLTAEPAVTAVEQNTRLQLTDAGRAVLAGQEDDVALNRVDCWIGGVHLTGRAVRWRWNDGIEAMRTSAGHQRGSPWPLRGPLPRTARKGSSWRWQADRGSTRTGEAD
jgi:hypothetical protein